MCVFLYTSYLKLKWYSHVFFKKKKILIITVKGVWNAHMQSEFMLDLWGGWERDVKKKECRYYSWSLRQNAAYILKEPTLTEIIVSLMRKNTHTHKHTKGRNVAVNCMPNTWNRMCSFCKDLLYTRTLCDQPVPWGWRDFYFLLREAQRRWWSHNTASWIQNSICNSLPSYSTVFQVMRVCHHRLESRFPLVFQTD